MQVIPFYGPNNKTTYDCFSQLYRVGFTLGKYDFTSSEQAMMCGKALIFEDHDAVQKIMKTNYAVEAKRLGRTVRNFDPKVWDKRKEHIVYLANYAKFSQNPGLAEVLLGTGDAILAEASPYDTIWGIGLNKHDHRVQNPQLWRGTNLLGNVLMRVRDDLKQ